MHATIFMLEETKRWLRHPGGPSRSSQTSRGKTHKHILTEESKSSQPWLLPWAGPWPPWLTKGTHFITELSSFPFHGQGNQGTERQLEFKLGKAAFRAIISTTTLYSSPTLPSSTGTACSHHTSPNLIKPPPSFPMNTCRQLEERTGRDCARWSSMHNGYDTATCLLNFL